MSSHSMNSNQFVAHPPPGLARCPSAAFFSTSGRRVSHPLNR
jgi:hypothetical protein